MRFRQQPPAYSPVSLGQALAPLTSESDTGQDVFQHFRSQYRAEHVELYGSGTQALQMAIVLAMRVQRTGEVALPAFGCYDLASAAVGAGATVRLYDIDPSTLAPDVESFSASLQAGAAIAVIAPLYGLAVPWEPLARVAAAHGCLLIEDAAQGFGTTWRGQNLGALGPISVLSFGRGKGWTCGGGGALLLRDGMERPHSVPVGRHRLRRTASLLAQWALARPGLYGLPASIPALGLGRTVYHAPATPQRLGPDGMAVLRNTQNDASAEVERRQRNASVLLEHLRDAGVDYYREPPESVAGWLRLPFRTRGAAREVMLRTGRQLGVAPSYPTPLDDVDALLPRLAPRGRGAISGASLLSRELVTLPTHSLLSQRDLVRLSELIHRSARAS